MNDNLYIVSAYGDYCGVDAATLISIPDEHCCDAEAIEDYLNADPDLCVKADARMIAAAPDMLAALVWAVETADTEQYEADWYAAARAAIAKAKGE